MKLSHPLAGLVVAIAAFSPAHAQLEFEDLLCEAAETGKVVKIVYDKDASKGCLPRRLMFTRSQSETTDSSICTAGRPGDAQKVETTSLNGYFVLTKYDLSK